MHRASLHTNFTVVNFPAFDTFKVENVSFNSPTVSMFCAFLSNFRVVFCSVSGISSFTRTYILIQLDFGVFALCVSVT